MTGTSIEGRSDIAQEQLFSFQCEFLICRWHDKVHQYRT